MVDGTSTHQRARVSGRRTGYATAVVVGAASLLLINVWPGWEAVPVLTEDTLQVLPLVNLSLAAGVVANIVYLANDARSWKMIGDLVTSVIGLVVMIQVWRVFPFDFPSTSFDWQILIRVLLVVGIVGTVIGLVVQTVTLVRRQLDIGARV